MAKLNPRYISPKPPALAQGWRLERMTPVSYMYGANGLRNGPDGRVYIAECVGSRISALDPDTGDLETISPIDGGIRGPDDLVFDDRGNLYATEFMDGRVSMRSPDGKTTLLRDDVPGANGITFHKGKVYIDECRLGGRLLELDPNGGAPRVILENLMLPNALSPGPDGQLYFPLVAAGEIWRVDPATGKSEKVVGGLHHPSAVKFDPYGRIVVTEAPVGEVVRIDPQSGSSSIIAKVGEALDNLTFVGDRLFVSHMQDGRISEILPGGKSRSLLPGGLHGPLGMTIGSDNNLYVADQIAVYVLNPGHGLRSLGRNFTPDYPGGVRGIAGMGALTFVVTTAAGKVATYKPWSKEHTTVAEGLDQPYGVAVASNGAFIVAELGAGKVLSIKDGKTDTLASGLSEPMGVALDADGAALVSEAAGGRVVKISGGKAESLVDGLKRPHGLAVRGGTIYIVDAGAQAVIAYDMAKKVRTTIAENLPVGTTPRRLPGMQPLVGPLGPFAGIAADKNGTLYVSADSEGSVIALRPS
jgi:sugar lactone lactonase YvrE